MSWRERVKEYQVHPGINYSTLKTVSINPAGLLSTERKETRSLNFGSAFETMLCFGEEEFKKDFVVADVDMPTGQMGLFCNKLIELGEISDDTFNQAYIATEAKRMTVTQFITNWYNSESAKRYTHLGIESKDKCILTSEEYGKLLDLVLKTKSSKFLQHLFTKATEYQKPLYRIDDGIEKKALYDMYIETTNGPVIIDIKTTAEGILGFPRAVLKYRYDLQAAWYAHVCGKPCSFYFLVIDTAYNNPPVLYYATPALLNKAAEGYQLNGRYYKGYKQLLSELIEHNAMNQFEYPMDIYKNEGIIALDF